MSTGRVVIGGAGGFMGQHFADRYRAVAREVVTIGRTGSDVTWTDATGIRSAIDGASLVLGLAGKSVNCRYTTANRAEIFGSRLRTTAALRDAIAAADAPPPVWINSSTATIYRHAEDRPMTEATGELGEGFSVSVAKAWEHELFAGELPGTRRVALRTAIVLGSTGGVLPTLERLARLGIGGTQLDGWWPTTARRRAAGTVHQRGSGGGSQRMSWAHVDDVARAIDYIARETALARPANVSAPHPVDNRTFMAAVRQRVGAWFAPPMPRALLEIGAIGIRTETELVLKSRWVLPERLLESGFTFAHPHLDRALDDLMR